jgi:uncharacterized protein YndB with AHSA1/START domain
MANLIASKTINIKSSKKRVWQALTSLGDIRQYLFGTNVETDWKEGSPIRWRGEWQGKAYQDKGTILKVEPGKLLQYTYWSSMAGKDDKPENYATVTTRVAGEDNDVTVTLTQDGNDNEQSKQHAEENWSKVLEGLKKVCEEKPY